MKTKINFNVGAVWYIKPDGCMSDRKEGFRDEAKLMELTTNKGNYVAFIDTDNGMTFGIEPRKKKSGYEVRIYDMEDMSSYFLFYGKTLHGVLANLYKRLNTDLASLKQELVYYSE